MDGVHRGQPEEEQYGDMGEWDSGQADEDEHMKCKGVL